VGQRKGLGVATGSPLYVININGARGQVTVGGNDELLSRRLIARDLNWIAFDDLGEEIARLATDTRVASDARVAQPPSAVSVSDARDPLCSFVPFVVNGSSDVRGLRVHAKIRHRHEPAPATIEPLSNGEALVTFDDPQRAITPGQAVVFYQDDLVVGGGWIAETLK